jgi:hypothetical protein
MDVFCSKEETAWKAYTWMCSAVRRRLFGRPTHGCVLQKGGDCLEGLHMDVFCSKEEIAWKAYTWMCSAVRRRLLGRPTHGCVLQKQTGESWN